MYCVIDNYIKFFEEFLIKYYQFLLKENYNKKYMMPFIEKYISVRYYNNTIYTRGYSFIQRINKELKNIAEVLITNEKDKERYIKKIFVLFGYILFIDGVAEYNNLNSLLKALYENEKLNLNFTGEEKSEFRYLINNFIKNKNNFIKVFDTNNFLLTKKKVAYNTYKVSIKNNCDISKLYSEYAIDKAFNSGTVVENKIYLTFILLLGEIFKQINELSYNTNYIVDFEPSLFGKSKKINRYLKAINNEMAISKININITYLDYVNNREIVNKIISDGYSVSLSLDETFVNEIRALDLFSYVFVYEKYDYYDIIIENRDNIKSKLIFM